MLKQFIKKIPFYVQLRNWLSIQWQKRKTKERQIRELDEWEAKGRPVPPPHIVKQKVIKDYAKKYHLSTFVETGTCYGDMVEAMRSSFDRIISIELSPVLFEKAKERFKTANHIQIWQGDSSKVIANVLGEIQSSALFWLDGHYSGGITARGDSHTPIRNELKHILSDKVRDHVILVDDARLFVGRNDYPTIEDLKSLVARERPGWICDVKNDIIRMHKLI